MAINRSDNLKINAGKPIDEKYLNSLNETYTGTSEVLSKIILSQRYVGLTVNVGNSEYWFKDGVTDGDLVVKDTDLSGTVNGAGNGLTLTGQTVILGGTLTGNTYINTDGNNIAFGINNILSGNNSTGFGYCTTASGYYSTAFGNCSVASGNSSTAFGMRTTASANNSTTFGCSTLASQYNSTAFGIGTTASGCNSTAFGYHSIASGKYSFAVGFCGIASGENSTAFGHYTTASGCRSIAFGNSTTASGCNSTAFGNNSTASGYNSTVFGCYNIIDSCNASILGGSNITMTGATYDNHSAVDNLAIWSTPTDGISTNKTLVWDSTSKKVKLGDSSDDISNSGITGATNGTNVSGKNVELGGNLTKTTIVGGDDTYKLTLDSKGLDLISDATDLVIDGQTNAQVVIKSQSGDVAGDNYTNAVGFDLNFSSGFKAIDNRATAKGIEYNADYSGDYTARSLVDKQYVDNMALGLDAKSSVVLATTTGETDINLSSYSSTIDGVTLQDGWRILIKNQDSNKEQNGIYTYSGSSNSFIRAEDFDGTPDGEVTKGAFMVVITGDTLSNTAWILTTDDPITIDTTELEFSLFSRILEIVGGDGIDVSILGGNNTVSVDLVSGTSALSFYNNQLRVDSSIAGTGLTMTDGVIDLDSIDTGILTASNGLTKSGTDVVLGGTLTGDTTINTNTFGIGIGNNVTVTGGDSVGFGYSTKATGNFSAAFGYQTTASGNTSTAFGYKTTASGDYSTAFGYSTKATGNFSAAFGYQTTGSGENSTAFGYCTTASACNSVAFGDITISSACNSIAFGNCTTASGCNSTASGDRTISSGDNSMAFGFLTTASGDDSTAFGRGTCANGCHSTVFGRDNTTDSCNASILGGSNITMTGSTYDNHSAVDNLAIWSTPTSGATSDKTLVWDSTDKKVKLGDSTDNIDTGILTANNGLSKSGTTVVLGGTLTGDTTINTGNFGIGIGNNVTSTGTNSVAFGKYSTASSHQSTAFGYGSTANQQQSTAFGYCGTAGGNQSTAFGYCTTASGNQSTAFGYCTTASGVGSTAFGYCSTVSGNQSTVFGYCSTVSGNQSTVFGSNNMTDSFQASILGGQNITMTGATYDNHSAVDNLAIWSTPISGTSDNILVWDDSDKKVKTISGSTLGEDNNNYDLTTITSNTTLTENEYIVLCNQSGNITVTLPATPTKGMAFKLKDVSGNALNNEITVSGNGNNIDGGTTAIINTDYGALELVYDLTLDEWFTLSFIN